MVTNHSPRNTPRYFTLLIIGDAALQVLLGVGVSLRYIDRSPNRSSGALLRAFVKACDVAVGEPFAVQMDIADSTSNITRGYREKEGPCYHPDAF